MTQRPLVPCTACERHVRAGELSCPFCGSEGSIPAPPVLRVPKGRLSSLLIMTFQAAAATTLGCGGETSDPGPSSGGAAGKPGTGGRAIVGTGGEEMGSGGFDTGTGGKSKGTGGREGTGGLIYVGSGGDVSQGRGGSIPIYRATPKG